MEAARAVLSSAQTLSFAFARTPPPRAPRGAPQKVSTQICQKTPSNLKRPRGRREHGTHMKGRATRNQKRQIWAGTCDETLCETDANSEAGIRRVTGCSLPVYGTRVPRTRARARPFASHASAALTLDCARHALVAIRVTIVTPHRFKRCGLSQERAAAALRPLMSPPVTAQTSSD